MLKPARKVEITAKDVAAILDMQARYVPKLVKLGRIKTRGKGYDAASVHDYKALHVTETAKQVTASEKLASSPTGTGYPYQHTAQYFDLNRGFHLAK